MRLKHIEKIVKILENSIVSEIEITDILGRKVRISKPANNSSSAVTPSVTKSPPAQAGEHEKEEERKLEENLASIKSPIVGTFYRSPAPETPAYVEIGDTVKPGQVVCIVEAMKLMNEIEADVAGKIVKILLKNEDPVEYNQKLFLVKPL